MKVVNRNPKQDGFYMPAEFQEHTSTYMIWPQRTDTWREGAKPAQEVFAEIANTIALYEPVIMLVAPSQYENALYQLNGNIRLVEMLTNDAWARDIGPTFVKNSQNILRGISWQFNAWGGLVDGLYYPWDTDQLVAEKICDLERVDCYQLSEFVLEGGAIHVDGEGTAIVTEACLLSSGRNPKMKKEEIETFLMNYLNLEKVIWLRRGIYGDETNEHVDNVCAFVRPGEVVVAWTEDKNDPQYELTQQTYEDLKSATDAKGRKIIIHRLELPDPMFMTEEEAAGIELQKNCVKRCAGDRLAASYVNFYLCNGAVIIPMFHDSKDEKILKKMKEIFPKRNIHGIFTREVLLGGGNIHCITQQVPK